MDISTGEIIAAPYYSNRFPDKKAVTETDIRNFNLVRHHIGSAFKPLLAFAAAVKYPALSQFSLTNIKKETNNCILIGYDVPIYGKDDKTGLFWSNNRSKNRIDFLGYSHNNYPIALTILALTENLDYPADVKVFNLLNAPKLDNTALNNLPKLLGNHYLVRVPKDFKFNKGETKLGESSLANLFFNLYDVEMDSRGKNDWELTADTMCWRHLKGNTLKLYSLYPDELNLQLDLINGFIDLENFVMGQGNNYWNNVKLAEAYSRLLSKKTVKATFLKGNEKFPDLFNDNAMFNHISPYKFIRTKQEIENVWISFMKDWREATQLRGGTLYPAYDSLKNSFRNNPDDNINNYHFYCKTGTPQVYNINKYVPISKEDGVTYLTSGELWRNEGIFVFGITNKDTANLKGIVGVVYIKRISDKEPTNRISGATARDFLTPDLYRKIMFYNQNRFK
jgi:hypothetical protein